MSIVVTRLYYLGWYPGGDSFFILCYNSFFADWVAPASHFYILTVSFIFSITWEIV